MIRIPQHRSQAQRRRELYARFADSEAATLADFLKAACLFDKGRY